MGRTARGVLLGVLALLVTGVLAGPATADVGDGSVSRMAVSVTVHTDGTLAVSEEITYSFTTTGHGIERWIPLEYPYDRHHVRVVEVDDVLVGSPTGAPSDLEQRDGRDVLHLRIGDPARLVTGEQTYRITYTVTGATTDADDVARVAWSAVGTQWRVPIRSAAVTARAPQILDVRCVQGTAQTTRDILPAEQSDGLVRCDAQGALPPGSGLAVVVDLPQGSVAVPAPQLRRTGFLGWLVLPATLTAFGVLLAGLAGLAALLWLHGRDRRFVGEIPGLEPPPGADRREGILPWGEERNVPVAFTPPEGLRPGEVGTLLDERANALDVTATILDLAQRGHLTIARRGPQTRGWASWADRWRITLADPQAAPSRRDLRRYEVQLLDALRHAAREVDGRRVIDLDHLGKRFGERLPQIQHSLYADVVERGWYRRPPDETRSDWTRYAAIACVVAGVTTVVLLVLGAWWLVGLAALLVCLALLWGARRMPARTGTGTAARIQALGFRKYLDTAEANQIRYEEQAEVLSRALPWAVVFGVTAHWSGVLAEVGVRFPVALQQLTVEDVPQVLRGLDDLVHLVQSLDGFAAQASNAVGHSARLSGVDAFEVGGAVLKLVGGLVVGGLGGGGGGGW